MKKIIFVLVLAILISSCAKQAVEEKTGGQAQIANPASVYCEEQGGKLEIRTNTDGSQTGYCIKDGTECEEWAFYRGECPEKIEITEQKFEEPKKLTIPSSIESNPFGFVPGAPEEAETVALAGAAWERPHPGPFIWGFIEEEKGSFDFEETDKWVKEAQKNNIAILATIWPYADWDQKICHSNECAVSEEDQFYPRSKMGSKEGIPKLRCAPCKLEDYKNFLSRLVERYDGDGAEDMPGLKIPIKYYEILNEPELKESFLTFYKGSQEEYAEILKESYDTIKSACSGCFVVQGGAAGASKINLDYWKKIFELAGNYFDIANIHFVKFGDLATLNVKDFKKLMQEKNVNKPLWVTEAEYSSESEVEQSADGALNEGASKIFFTRFEAGKSGPPTAGKYSKAYDKVIQRYVK